MSIADQIEKMREKLPYALEVARQLSDQNKALPRVDLLLRWDADTLPCPPSDVGLTVALSPFAKIDAIRMQRQQQSPRHEPKYVAFLPRRRERACPYHGAVCLPTREDKTHHQIALETLESALREGKTSHPTFLVDLLDPWPRGYTAPSASRAREAAMKPAMRYFVLQRDQFRCQLCGVAVHDSADVRLAVDHKISVAHGGQTIPENLWVLCSLCNAGKGAQSL